MDPSRPATVRRVLTPELRVFWRAEIRKLTEPGRVRGVLLGLECHYGRAAVEVLAHEVAVAS